MWGTSLVDTLYPHVGTQPIGRSLGKEDQGLVARRRNNFLVDEGVSHSRGSSLEETAPDWPIILSRQRRSSH